MPRMWPGLLSRRLSKKRLAEGATLPISSSVFRGVMSSCSVIVVDCKRGGGGGPSGLSAAEEPPESSQRASASAARRGVSCSIGTGICLYTESRKAAYCGKRAAMAVRAMRSTPSNGDGSCSRIAVLVRSTTALGRPESSIGASATRQLFRMLSAMAPATPSGALLNSRQRDHSTTGSWHSDLSAKRRNILRWPSWPSTRSSVKSAGFSERRHVLRYSSAWDVRSSPFCTDTRFRSRRTLPGDSPSSMPILLDRGDTSSSMPTAPVPAMLSGFFFKSSCWGSLDSSVSVTSSPDVAREGDGGAVALFLSPADRRRIFFPLLLHVCCFLDTKATRDDCATSNKKEARRLSFSFVFHSWRIGGHAIMPVHNTYFNEHNHSFEPSSTTEMVWRASQLPWAAT